MSCNDLTIIVDPEKWKIDIGNIHPKHGNAKSIEPHKVVLCATGFYGPDCRIGFTDDEDYLFSIVNFQQNFCFAKSGHITVTPVKGKTPDYDAKEGSYEVQRGGVVEIKGFFD
ncbi:MAG TPA: hypothetical protein VMW72_20245 [Sedimentisphaerales bacterium]|nr:hypothetical protein [Sedimentisphaerales bacterium]